MGSAPKSFPERGAGDPKGICVKMGSRRGTRLGSMVDQGTVGTLSKVVGRCNNCRGRFLLLRVSSQSALLLDAGGAEEHSQKTQAGPSLNHGGRGISWCKRAGSTPSRHMLSIRKRHTHIGTRR